MAIEAFDKTVRVIADAFARRNELGQESQLVQKQRMGVEFLNRPESTPEGQNFEEGMLAIMAGFAGAAANVSGAPQAGGGSSSSGCVAVARGAPHGLDPAKSERLLRDFHSKVASPDPMRISTQLNLFSAQEAVTNFRCFPADLGRLADLLNLNVDFFRRRYHVHAVDCLAITVHPLA